MPRNTVYWTRKLELQLVEFVRQREYIWKPIGNTNHHIQQKYRAYAEFAAQLGRGFTARSVRDRWVNIRSTFNHNLRKVEKSKLSVSHEVYVPCWPLWKPLQFLCEGGKKNTVYQDQDYENKGTYTHETDIKIELFSNNIKNETTNCESDQNYDKNKTTNCENNQNYNKNETTNSENDQSFNIRQRDQWTNRPRVKRKPHSNKCIKVLNNLITSLKPVVKERSSYYYFGKHVTERLNSMREIDAQCASREIVNYLKEMEFVTALKGEST